MFFGKKENKETEKPKDNKESEKTTKEPEEKNKAKEASADSNKKPESGTGSSSDGEAELTKEDVKKIKVLFAEQETEIE